MNVIKTKNISAIYLNVVEFVSKLYYFLPGHFLQRSPFLNFLQQSFFFLQHSVKTVVGQLF